MKLVLVASLLGLACSQTVLTNNVWISTSSGRRLAITPTVIDGVTISASPVTSTPTPWVSLDGSGIPYAITPTVDGSSTISASPAPSASDYPAATGVPPVLRCFGDRVPDSKTIGYPFCIKNGTELVVGETYWVTWDPSYWGGNINRVKLYTRAYPLEDNDDALFMSSYISNNNGYFPWTIKSSYKKSGSAGYFFLNITPLVSSTTEAKHVGTKSGPLLRIVDSVDAVSPKITRVPSDNGYSASSSSGGGSSKGKVIVPAVVVPVVVLSLVGALLWYFLFSSGKSDRKILDVIRLKSRGQESFAQETVAAHVDAESIITTDIQSNASGLSEFDEIHSTHTDETRQANNPFA